MRKLRAAKAKLDQAAVQLPNFTRSRHVPLPGWDHRNDRLASLGINGWFRSGSVTAIVEIRKLAVRRPWRRLGGVRGSQVREQLRIAVDIVRKQPFQVGFAVWPRRWVVGRFFAWIGRNRRPARDFEATNKTAEALLCVASVMILWS